MKITKIRHAWPERPNHVIDRPYGAKEYIFLHFWVPVQILINGDIITTKPHACIIFDKNTPQYFTSDEVFIHDWMHISGSVPKYTERFGIELDKIYYPKNHHFITELTRELEQEFSSTPKFSSYMFDYKIKELFIKFSRELNEKISDIPLNFRTIELLKELRLKLCSNYYDHWDINTMAEYIGLSPSYLYASYKTYYKISPVQDLISIKIERAKSLLTSTQLATQDIATALGYQNTTHFIRQFTKIVGTPPLKYRQRHELKTRYILN